MKYQLIEKLRNSSGVIKKAMDEGWDIPELSEALEGTRDILVDINPNKAKQILCDIVNGLGERDLNYLLSWVFTRGHIEDNDALAPALQGYYENMAEMFLGEKLDRKVIELLGEAQKLYNIRIQGDKDEDPDLKPRFDAIIKMIGELTGMTVEADERGVLRVVDPTDKEEEELRKSAEQ